jgi:hypothetical protein
MRIYLDLFFREKRHTINGRKLRRRVYLLVGDVISMVVQLLEVILQKVHGNLKDPKRQKTQPMKLQQNTTMDSVLI